MNNNLPAGVLENTYAPINEKSFEISYKVICRGTLPNNRWFQLNLDEIKDEIEQDLKGLNVDFVSVEKL